jgi:hypothetical protein
MSARRLAEARLQVMVVDRRLGSLCGINVFCLHLSESVHRSMNKEGLQTFERIQEPGKKRA